MLEAQKILLVEDNREMQILVVHILDEYQVVGSPSLKQAQELLDKEDFCLIILDVELPDGDGIHFLSRLRQSARHREVPVIILTSLTDISRKVIAFNLGADDFVTKPFEPLELRARVQARIRIFHESTKAKPEFRVNDIILNAGEQRAWIAVGAVRFPLALTALEFRLLSHLLRNGERVSVRDALLKAVWGDETNVLDRTIDTHVSHLRKKLVKSATAIESVIGSGYRISSKPAR